VAAARREPKERLGLRRLRRMAAHFGVEQARGFGLEGGGANDRSGRGAAGALLRDGGEAPSIAAGRSHRPHVATMLAVSSAAGREGRVGTGSEDRREQCPAEKHQHRKCDRAAHKTPVNLM